MKKYVFLLVSLFVFNLTVLADDDKPIKVTEMPGEAQTFIKKHFANQSVAVAKMEKDWMDRSYEVIFTNGDKVEFDKKGKWTEVDCEYSQVPVAVIPAAIQKYINQHYPNTKVLKIELKDKRGYEVELSNDIELEFDKHFNITDID